VDGCGRSKGFSQPKFTKYQILRIKQEEKKDEPKVQKIRTRANIIFLTAELLDSVL